MLISPKYDVFMKEMFHNKTVLTCFLSDVLGLPLKKIQSVRLSA